MAEARWYCVRTEARSFPAYDIGVERGVLEPRGVLVESLDIDDPDAFARAAARADAVLHMRGVLDGARIARLERCRIIAHYGTGVDRVDLRAATGRGIWVTNGPRYAIDEVSSHAIALLLAAARKIVAADRAVRSGAWHIKPIVPLHRIAGATLGLLGFGNIARPTGRKGRALGLRVIAHDPYVAAQVFAEEGVSAVDFDNCLREADYLSVHLPVTAATRGIVDRRALG